MDAGHFNELIELCQEICDHANDRIANYCAQKYCGVGNDTTEQQLEDYLFVAEETCTYLLGNALALLSRESQEAEINTFLQNLRKVMKFAEQKLSGEDRNKPLPS